MTEWRRVPLKHLVEINRRALPASTPPDAKIRYLDISACGRGILLADPEPMTFGSAPSRARRLVQPGDTIVSTVRTYLRAVWPVDGSTDDLVVSTGFAVLSPRPRLDARYLAWLLQSDEVIEEIVARSVGVSYPAINPSELGEISVRVPDLPEQRSVAASLGPQTARLDGVIGARRQLLKMLSAREQALIDIATAPSAGDEWVRVPVKRLLSRIEQGWSPQAEARPADDDEWGVLKAGAANGGVFHVHENKALPSDIEPRREYEVRAGDVLVSRANTRELVASTCIVPEVRRRLLLCDKLFRLTPRPDVDPRYLVYALRSAGSREAIEAEATGASDSMQNIGQDTVRELRIWTPKSHSAQASISDRLDSALSEVRRLRAAMNAHIALLLERRHALTTRMVTGQVDTAGVAR